ncbi:MAG: glycosyltransferase family 2 protein [Saprospiraceae bacterium]|nr:glycosyltransferase family 2 protein [Saprospiraceae bacterium]
MSKLSAIVITYNESMHIKKCIESLLPVADEIVVLDSYSTDDTPQICKNLGVRFYQKKFEGYGPQKQAAAKLAQYNHILSLDADECLDPDLTNAILHEKSLGFKDLYLLNRITWYVSGWVKHCGWYPDLKIRLWNTSKAGWTDDKLHETIIAKNKTEKVQKLNGHLLHFSYLSKEEHFKQLEHFASIAARDLQEKGKKSNMVNLYLKPVYKFFSIYILKKGFLDGHIGWNIACRSAFGVKRKYELLREFGKED